MATKQIFNGKQITLPGVYTAIKSGLKNPPLDLPYGNILIIDTGSSEGWGGGSGIVGELAQGVASVYELPDIQTYQNFFKGGLFWKLGEPLFTPNGPGSLGVSKVYVVREAETTPAAITYTFTGGGANGGVLLITTRDEGTVANGLLEEDADNLYIGYAAKMTAGVIDPTKFIIKFYRGTWKGNDENNAPYEMNEYWSQPILLCQTPEFNTVDQLNHYFQLDALFNTYFIGVVDDSNGTGVVDAADLTANLEYELAVGGTESYGDLMTEVFDAIADLDYSFILGDKWGLDAYDTEMVQILSHILTEAKFEKQLILGGGSNISEWNTGEVTTLSLAALYNSDRVILVHGGVKKTAQNNAGFRNFQSIYKAAVILGRICGLPPQVPATFKGIDIDGELHSLTQKEKELGLASGVLMTAWDSDFGRFSIVQDVNTLQNNDYLINDDGTTHAISIRRISAQLNKEVLINVKKQLLGQVDGVNRYTLSEKTVKDYIIGFLQRKTVSTTSDNLILSFQDVVVTRDQDVYNVTYKFTPNGPINKLFITGFMID